ncbi:MAG: HEAT repeat domain-containing protein [Gemmatales bacterium]
MACRTVLAGCIGWLLISANLLAQLPPDKALSSFTVAEGLKLELFAAEPMFSNPTCMDIDDKGRVWVCESVNYRTTLRKQPVNRKEGDRIVILTDTKGVGKADKVTTFYQAPDFLAPLGIAVSKDPVGPGYKVYVCHSPHIYVFEDKDGDGKADGPPKILLTGFGGIDHDHGVHGIHFGPDGKLYFSVGDQGVKNLKGNASGGRKPPEKASTNTNERTYTTNQTDCKAGTIWRCNTDGSNLELLAHNFRNQYEPAVNSFGTMFVSDNDDDGSMQTRICHVMYGGDYGYWPRNRGDHHWHEDQPGVVHKTLRTGFGSPTGLCWYEGKLLHGAFSRLLAPPLTKGRLGGVDAAAGSASAPQNLPQPLLGKEGSQTYEGYLLHTDAGPREVRLFGVRPKGAGYELDRVNLVTSNDNWFRPSDVCVAPDGSVFIADWYDPGVGGHGMGDTTRGRIYRLVPKSDTKSDYMKAQNGGELAKEQFSPCLCTRQVAFEKFKATNPTIEDVQQFNDTNDDIIKSCFKDSVQLQNTMTARQRWFDFLCEDYFHFEDVGLFKDETPESILKHIKEQEKRFTVLDKVGFNSSMRNYAGHYHSFDNMPKDLQLRTKIRVHPDIDPMIAREMLVWNRLSGVPTAKEFIYRFAKSWDGKDRTLLSALNIACGTDPARREAILADFEKHFPAWDDKTAWLVWELRPPTVIAKLGRKLSVEVMTPLQTELALGALAASTGVDGGESLLKLLDDTKVKRQTRAAAIKALLQHLPGKWSSLKGSLLVQKAIEAQMTDGELLPAVVELVAVCERKDFQGFLEHLAFNTEGFSNQVRYAAIAALGKLKTKESAAALVKLLIQPQEMTTRKEIITALGKMGTKDALVPLQTYFLDNKLDAEPRRMVLEGLTNSRAGTSWLLEMQAKKELPDAMLAETGRLLRSSPYQDLRNKALIAFPIAKKMDVAKLPSPSVLAQKSGNAEHGKQIVLTNKDLGCIKCHGFQGIGGHIGPDLSMIGIKGSKENLFESILTPDKAIADQFVQYVIETKNGVVMTGLIVEETGDYIILRDANGKDIKLTMRDIESRTKSAKSIMPDNLVSFLTEDELVDVVAYLTTLKSPALSIDRWQVVGPFPSDKSDSGLEKQFGPEEGYSTNTTYPGKKGPVKWTNINTNAAGYLDLAELHGDDGINSVSYVYAEIDAPKEGWGDIKLGTDDGVNVIFNGKLVFKHRRHEAAEPGKDTIAVEFQKGKNTLMLQVSNGDNPHGVYCTVLTPGSEPAKLVTPK